MCGLSGDINSKDVKDMEGKDQNSIFPILMNFTRGESLCQLKTCVGRVFGVEVNKGSTRGW